METKLLQALSTLLSLGAYGGLLACAVVAGLAAPRLRRRGWLVAWAGIELANLVSTRLFYLLADAMSLGLSGAGVFTLVNMVSGWLFAVSLGCLVYFLLAQVDLGGRPLSLGALLFSFRGRVPRLAYWVGTCALVCVTWTNAANLLNHLAREQSRQGNAVALYLALGLHVLWALASLYPLLVIQAKRWHDRGKSAWMILVNAIPLVGPLWALVELGFLSGTPGPNAYGEDPLGRAAGDPYGGQGPDAAPQP